MSQLKAKLTERVKKAALNSHGIGARYVMLARYFMSEHGNDSVEEAIFRFSSQEQRSNKRWMRRTRRHVLRDVRKYLITPDEYFLYDFEWLSDAGKHQFVGDLERSFLCSRLYNSSKSGLIFMDKMKTYELFNKYYKRDVINIDNDNDFEKYVLFSKRNPTHMVKPSKASRGFGIYKETVSQEEKSMRAAFQRIRDAGACVVEECIVQGKDMARYHPGSVNTLRYATYLDEGRLTVLASFVKLGRGDSVVDNGGAGGLLAAIDPETGIIISKGRSEYGEEYLIHPDSQVQILGASIPNWTEVRLLAEELAHVLPDQKYVGWDLAYTDKGWVMVEGNSGGQFVGPQITLKTGIRPLVEKTFGVM